MEGIGAGVGWGEGDAGGGGGEMFEGAREESGRGDGREWERGWGRGWERGWKGGAERGRSSLTASSRYSPSPVGPHGVPPPEGVDEEIGRWDGREWERGWKGEIERGRSSIIVSSWYSSSPAGPHGVPPPPPPPRGQERGTAPQRPLYPPLGETEVVVGVVVARLRVPTPPRPPSQSTSRWFCDAGRRKEGGERGEWRGGVMVGAIAASLVLFARRSPSFLLDFKRSGFDRRDSSLPPRKLSITPWWNEGQAHHSFGPAYSSDNAGDGPPPTSRGAVHTWWESLSPAKQRALMEAGRQAAPAQELRAGRGVDSKTGVGETEAAGEPRAPAKRSLGAAATAAGSRPVSFAAAVSSTLTRKAVPGAQQRCPRDRLTMWSSIRFTFARLRKLKNLLNEPKTKPMFEEWRQLYVRVVAQKSVAEFEEIAAYLKAVTARVTAPAKALHAPLQRAAESLASSKVEARKKQGGWQDVRGRGKNNFPSDSQGRGPVAKRLFLANTTNQGGLPTDRGQYGALGGDGPDEEGEGKATPPSPPPTPPAAPPPSLVLPGDPSDQPERNTLAAEATRHPIQCRSSPRPRKGERRCEGTKSATL